MSLLDQLHEGNDFKGKSQTHSPLECDLRTSDLKIHLSLIRLLSVKVSENDNLVFICIDMKNNKTKGNKFV